MTHRHACSHGHYWECEGTAVRIGDSIPSLCMCIDHREPMEQGNHSECTIELLDCPTHRNEHTAPSDGETNDIPVEDGWVPIKVPDNLEEMFQAWKDSSEPNIGWCLMCNNPIRTENDLIPGTNSHNCAEGRALDGKIRGQSEC